MSKAVAYQTVEQMYYGRLNGQWNTGRTDGVKDIGPCIVMVKMCYYIAHHDSYFVYINGRHQCGGMVRHGYATIARNLDLIPWAPSKGVD